MLTKWALFTSFWGKNAVDVIGYHSKINQTHKIGCLIYEAEKCGAAEAAKENDIPNYLVSPEKYKNQREYQLFILELLKKNEITHIFLLSYQYLILNDILSAFPDRIVNIHPSLFPSFLATKTAIHDALNYGVKITGITTHIIDEEYDKGLILFQEAIRIKENDTFESLYSRFPKKAIKLILKSMQKVESLASPRT